MSAETSRVLERAWAVLSPPTGRQLASYPLDISFSDRHCRVALDATGARHVLIPVQNEPVQPDRKPSVLELSVRRLVFDSDDTTYVDLSCAERDLFEEFDDVVSDVLEAAKESDLPGTAAVRAVARWRRLFRSRLIRGLSHQARLGLFAELTVLSALLECDLSLDAWRGPLREAHDFECPVRCLEVKAIGPDTTSVRIHGLSQLDGHDGRPLDLLLVDVVEDPDGQTLTELVESLRQCVPSPIALRQRLAAAGWTESPGTDDIQCFVAGSVRRIGVDTDVPRLTPSDLVRGALAEGVTDLQYSLELDALLPFATAASLAQICKEACG